MSLLLNWLLDRICTCTDLHWTCIWTCIEGDHKSCGLTRLKIMKAIQSSVHVRKLLFLCGFSHSRIRSRISPKGFCGVKVFFIQSLIFLFLVRCLFRVSLCSLFHVDCRFSGLCLEFSIEIMSRSKTTTQGFEPWRPKGIPLAGEPVNHSGTSSYVLMVKITE